MAFLAYGIFGSQNVINKFHYAPLMCLENNTPITPSLPFKCCCGEERTLPWLRWLHCEDAVTEWKVAVKYMQLLMVLVGFGLNARECPPSAAQ